MKGLTISFLRKKFLKAYFQGQKSTLKRVTGLSIILKASFPLNGSHTGTTRSTQGNPSRQSQKAVSVSGWYDIAAILLLLAFA